MGNTKVSRRKFFDQLQGKSKQVTIGDLPGEEDPLFKKYSRKKLGARVYRTGMVKYEKTAIADEALRVGNVTSGLAPYAGPWTEWEALHLLRRTGFGYKKAYVDSLLPMSPDAAVETVLNVS